MPDATPDATPAATPAAPPAASSALAAGPAGASAATLLPALQAALQDERRRRQALERELRASETRYRAMVEDQTDLVALLDAEGALRYANTALADLLGQPPEALVGRPLGAFLPASEAASLRGQLRLARERVGAGAGAGAVLGETRVHAPHAGERHIEWTHRAVPAEPGHVADVHAVGRDITERKRLERELFGSEMRYRSLFDHMQSGFALHELIVDGQGQAVDLRYLAINAAHARMMGQPIDRMVGHCLSELYRGQETDAWLQTFAEVALSGQTQRFERHSRHFDRWYDVIAYQPAPMQVATIVEDVTARKRAQQVVQEQHEKLQVTLHSIGDAVITTCNEGRVQFLNPVAERLTGWRDDEARGQALDTVFRLVDESTRLPLSNPLSRCLVEGPMPLPAAGSPSATDGSSTATLVHRLGTEAGIEESVAPIRATDGRTMGAVLVFRDVTDQRRMAREMSYRATHDALTGLVNRADFESRLQHTLKLAHADGSMHALMVIDLDQFKLVNDACGHAAGDQLLRQVSALLKGAVRARDTLARLGGDEFGVILEFCPPDQALRVAEQICERMDEYRFPHGDRRFRVGASIGLVPLDPRWPSTQSAMQAADASCYAAKEAGRNRVHAWVDADHHLRARHGEMQWVARLEQALDDDRFELFGQRIAPINAEVGGLHCEVLLRLRGSDDAIVSPGAFLPAAERFHLATRIDRWVVGAVVRWMAQHRTRLGHVATIAVNLSGHSIGDATFLRHVADMLAHAPIDARQLCFEVTETAAITNMNDAIAFIDAMRAHGIRFALDDFGAGASGFGYLKTLPVDYLKIDGQFVRDLIDDPLDRAAVRCFREVAAAVGTQTIAEFVETAATAEVLRELGIDYGQGYLYHRPEPLDDAVGLLSVGQSTS